MIKPLSLIAAACAVLAPLPAQSQSEPPRVRVAPHLPPPAPALARRYPVVGPAGIWTLPATREVLGGPDWSDYEIYPEVSRRREQEGAVMFALRVGADGAAKACRILVSSNFVELDDGTCDLAMGMRFRPAAAAGGRPTESVYRARVTWLLADQFTLAPGRMRVTLAFNRARANSCEVEVEGALPAGWPRSACRMIAGDLRHFLGGSYGRARRATVTVTLRPPGDETRRAAPPGRLVAGRRTEFALNDDGDPIDCHAVTNRGFGPRSFDYSGPCGLFLSQAWLRPAAGRDWADRGALEIKVHVER